jgi:hypothetical protein
MQNMGCRQREREKDSSVISQAEGALISPSPVLSSSHSFIRSISSFWCMKNWEIFFLIRQQKKK